MPNPKKQGFLLSIFNLRCPRCRKGKAFPTSSFSFRQPFTMYSHCPECQLNFEPEPGFYYGAMFISYIWTGFFSLFFIMLLHWVFGMSVMVSFAALILLNAICFVYIFRISRMIWLTIHQRIPDSTK